MIILQWIHTIFFFIWMWLILFLSIFFLIPLLFLNIPGLRKGREPYIRFITRLWAKQHMLTSLSRITVEGKENIPENGAFCVIGNHQGNFDIPLIMSHLPRTLGFIAKAELRKVPFVSSWMKAMGCVFIDRKNLRSSIEALRQAVAQVEAGQCIVLFPEGTRSRSGQPGKFNSAGIRLLVEKQCTILPVTIVNSRSMLEKHKRITPAKVKLIIHPVQEFKKEQASEAVDILKSLIVAPLES